MLLVAATNVIAGVSTPRRRFDNDVNSGQVSESEILPSESAFIGVCYTAYVASFLWY